MDAFPAYFPLAGRRVVIAGEGLGAEAKARLFEGSPAEVMLVRGEVALRAETYAGACLAFIASADAAFRTAAAAAARAASAPVNVVDHPDLSDFHTPAVIDRGAVVAAVGTAGAAPLLASLLRAEVEARVPQGAGLVAVLLRRHQQAVRTAFPDLGDRRAFLRGLLSSPSAEAAMAGRMEEASRLLEAALAAGGRTSGRVSLICASGGDLASLRAVRALGAADVVAADDASQAFVGSHARRDVERLPFEEATAVALAALAADGRQVAVVAARLDTSLAEAVRAAGARVDVHLPAPAP